MAACGIVFAALGGPLARALTPDDDVARIAERLLWVAAFFQVLDAINIVLRGALRGAKDVKVPMMIGIVVIWTSSPTAAFLLGKYVGWGALGGWCGFVLETVLSSMLFAIRWKRGAWRDAYTASTPRSPDPSCPALPEAAE
jgi:MATE family multidrug resistance protein